EAAHVADEVNAFERLWLDQAKSIKVLEFPEAVRNKVLEFVPADDELKALIEGDKDAGRFRLWSRHDMPAGRFDWSKTSSGSKTPESTVDVPDGPPAVEVEKPLRLMPEEVRRVAWTYIVNAPRMWNGIRVGECTSAVKPWPHQLRTFAR